MTNILSLWKTNMFLFCFLFIFLAISLESNAQNNTIATPEFSAEHGFYDDDFDLIITAKTVGANIKYTLDGSDPRTSKTAGVTSSPATVHIDPASTIGRGVTPAVVVRAVGVREGYQSSKVVTKTYIFIDAVKTQAYPGHDWPEYNINNQILDWAVDTEISINNAEYAGQLNKALLDIPSFSIVTDNKNLFSAATGIFVNPSGHGKYWERAASVELINPDQSEGFQIDAGIRIRGGYSRITTNPKHAFRLFFRSEYGEAKLNYPLFEDEGVSEFDKIDLRTAQNYSWSYDGGGSGVKNTFVREVFSRDVQREMNQPYTRSRYYHLYLNGIYWGLFQTQERSEASYAEMYFGGDRDDYDVIKVNTNADYTIEATDGTIDAWTRLYEMAIDGFDTDEAYYMVQGLNIDGTRNSEYEKLLDIDNLIDYMISVFYSGDEDAPISDFINNLRPNNFYAIYNREDPDGFIFFRHDAEHSMGSRSDVNCDRTGPFSAGYESVLTSNPQMIHQQLVAHPDYVARFTDRANKYFFNNGLLTPDSVVALFQPRINTIEYAIIGESARWGDSKTTIPYTKQDWEDEINSLFTEYVPYRTDTVVKQLNNKGWLTSIVAPVLKINNVVVFEEEREISGAINLVLENPNGLGTILYSTDGNDPRKSNGVTSPDAQSSSNSEVTVGIDQTTILKVRIKDGDTWSALREIKLIKPEDYSNLIISEIHYNPADLNDINGEFLEFIELKNTGDSAINLTLCSFTNGIKYTFDKATTIDSGGYVVLASNIQKFKQRYSGIEPVGEYTGQLNNSGEKINLISPQDSVILSFKYNDSKPWPKIADGAGFSLVSIEGNAVTDPNLPEYWNVSSVMHGTPGEANVATTVLPVLVNEIMTHSEYPGVDTIELYNPNDTEVNIGYWYLTDKYSKPNKWQIPAGTIIPAKGYLVFKQGHYVGETMVFSDNEFGSEFSYSSHGESAYVFSANQNGVLTGYAHGFDFDATDLQLPFGRYITNNNEEHFVLQHDASFGSENTGPNVGPVVINKIMYKPSGEGCEFIELVNIGNEVVNLFDTNAVAGNWFVKGLDFEFQDSVSLKPKASIYLIDDKFTVNEFKSAYVLDSSVQVFNFNGKLKGSETISVIRPSVPYLDVSDTLIDEYLVDQVSYSNEQPWPTILADGYFLQKSDTALYGNDPVNWTDGTYGLSIAFDAPKATEAVIYYAKLKAVSGKAPFNWKILTGSLPTNMVLDTVSGEISGISSQIGVSELSISVTDTNGLVATSDITIEVLANSAPVAVDDYVNIAQNINSNIDVLTNDIDKDGDKYDWSISISQAPQNGTAVIDTITKSIIYSPAINFAGNDTIEYQLSHLGKTSNAKVIITIEAFNEGDFDALVAIYNALDGDNWNDNTGWNTEINNVSNAWSGVQVANGRVVGLYLNENNLNGSLPDEIGNLTALQILQIVGNPNLTGEIPKTIGNLKELILFYFYINNNLSGEIPKELGELTNLQLIILANCDVSGTIPKELGNLTNLVELYIFGTEVSGEVPDEFANLTNLSTLWLTDNYLTGLPDLSHINFTPFEGISNYTGFCVKGNNLRFNDIEPNLSVLSNVASYSPQRTIEISPETQPVIIGEELLLTCDIEGDNNEYQWFKGTKSVSEKSNSPDFYIANVTSDDLGKYRCKITDPAVDGLTLTTSFITVVDQATSVEFALDNDIRIYANNKYIHIESGNDNVMNGMVEIYDLSGKKLISRKLQGVIKDEINANSLVVGAYIVRLINDFNIYTEKVIIR